MAVKTVHALFAIALLAGCKAQPETNQANTVVPSAEAQNTAAAAAAGPVTKEQALAVMKQRHEGMEAIGDATKKANNALKASTPDLAAIRDSAAKINAIAPKVQSLFPAGSGPDVGKTRAKAEIWQKPEDFALKAHDFETAASQFDVAAKSGDAAQIKMTFDALGKSCKACHDLYRASEKH